ncbi:MAG: ABC transporter substrate-binding protein, partial [Vulcanisaeta sp.]
VNYTVNWTYAAQLLESAGLYKKGNQWYLPNGTPLTLTLYVNTYSSSWDLIMSEVAEQLALFGIPTKIITMEPGIFYHFLFAGELPGVGGGIEWLFAGFNKGSYEALWTYYDYPAGAAPLLLIFWEYSNVSYPFAYPITQDNHITGWYCQPLVLSQLSIPNATVVSCINSTFGYINLTNYD